MSELHNYPQNGFWIDLKNPDKPVSRIPVQPGEYTENNADDEPDIINNVNESFGREINYRKKYERSSDVEGCREITLDEFFRESTDAEMLQAITFLSMKLRNK